MKIKTKLIFGGLGILLVLLLLGAAGALNTIMYNQSTLVVLPNNLKASFGLVSNYVAVLPNSGGNATIYGTNQVYRTNVTSGITIALNSLLNNIVYTLELTNNTSTISYADGTIRWWDGEILSSAPSLQRGTYVVHFKVTPSGTNGWIGVGPSYLSVPGSYFNFSTNNTTGQITYNANGGSSTTQLTGTGGGSTDFTIQANGGDQLIAGNVNVTILAAMSYNAIGNPLFWSLLVTNGSGANKTITFSATTNRWKWSYSAAAPDTLTNGTQLYISARQDGTNILANYAYYSWP